MVAFYISVSWTFFYKFSEYQSYESNVSYQVKYDNQRKGIYNYSNVFCNPYNLDSATYLACLNDPPKTSDSYNYNSNISSNYYLDEYSVVSSKMFEDIYYYQMVNIQESLEFLKNSTRESYNLIRYALKLIRYQEITSFSYILKAMLNNASNSQKAFSYAQDIYYDNWKPVFDTDLSSFEFLIHNCDFANMTTTSNLNMLYYNKYSTTETVNACASNCTDSSPDILNVNQFCTPAASTDFADCYEANANYSAAIYNYCTSNFNPTLNNNSENATIDQTDYFKFYNSGLNESNSNSLDRIYLMHYFQDLNGIKMPNGSTCQMSLCTAYDYNQSFNLTNQNVYNPLILPDKAGVDCVNQYTAYNYDQTYLIQSTPCQMLYTYSDSSVDVNYFSSYLRYVSWGSSKIYMMFGSQNQENVKSYFMYSYNPFYGVGYYSYVYGINYLFSSLYIVFAFVCLILLVIIIFIYYSKIYSTIRCIDFKGDQQTEFESTVKNYLKDKLAQKMANIHVEKKDPNAELQLKSKNDLSVQMDRNMKAFYESFKQRTYIPTVFLKKIEFVQNLNHYDQVLKTETASLQKDLRNSAKKEHNPRTSVLISNYENINTIKKSLFNNTAFKNRIQNLEYAKGKDLKYSRKHINYRRFMDLKFFYGKRARSVDYNACKWINMLFNPTNFESSYNSYKNYKMHQFTKVRYIQMMYDRNQEELKVYEDKLNVEKVVKVKNALKLRKDHLLLKDFVFVKI